VNQAGFLVTNFAGVLLNLIEACRTGYGEDEGCQLVWVGAEGDMLRCHRLTHKPHVSAQEDDAEKQRGAESHAASLVRTSSRLYGLNDEPAFGKYDTVRRCELPLQRQQGFEVPA
jgi:hypothetical protein